MPAHNIDLGKPEDLEKLLAVVNLLIFERLLSYHGLATIVKPGDEIPQHEESAYKVWFLLIYQHFLNHYAVQDTSRVPIAGLELLRTSIKNFAAAIIDHARAVAPPEAMRGSAGVHILAFTAMERFWPGGNLTQGLGEVVRKPGEGLRIMSLPQFEIVPRSTGEQLLNREVLPLQQFNIAI